jgi:hypothetical protein
MKRQGAKGVRLNAIYGRIKAEGYGRYDDAVNAIRAAGLHPQMTIMGTPRYSTQWDQTLSPTSNDPRQWQTFSNEVAQHFKGRVHRYSIDNEPNIDAFLKGSSANPVAGGRQYRNIYRYGRMGVKSVDPGAQVMIGELAPSHGAKQFMQGLLGGKALRTEGFAYHPYDQPGVKMRNGRNPYSLWDIDTLGDLQATLKRYQRQGKLQTAQGGAAPLYLTEFGRFRGGQNLDDARMRQLARAYAQAKQAGAKQFLQYQLLPSTPHPDGSWTWDTSIGDAAGNLPVINRGMKLTARSPIARAARKKGR